MIGKITGKIITKTPNLVLVDVGGIGYEIEISMNTYSGLAELGDQITLYTHLQIREDAHILFGFLQESERLVFRQLIKVIGLGPKTALSVLSTFTITQLAKAIIEKDSTILTRVPGIGKKTAERLLIELQDKFPSIDQSTTTTNSITQIRDALISLGYKDSEIQKQLKDLPMDTNLEEGIRIILQKFSKVG